MKKIAAIFISIILVISSFVFMASAESYSNEYFSFEVADGYEYEGSDGYYTWANENGSVFSVVLVENTLGASYDNLTDVEMQALDNQVKANYSAIEGITFGGTVESEKGTFKGHNIYNYFLDFTAYGVLFEVEGGMFTTDDYIITIEISFVTDEDEEAVTDMLSSLTFEFDSETVNTTVADNEYESDDSDDEISSKDGLLSFELPADFTEVAPPEGFERIWSSTSSPKTGIGFMIRDNTEDLSFVNLTSSEKNDLVETFAEEAGEQFTNVNGATCVINGYDGFKITGDISITGITAETEIYMFSTEEKLVWIYAYIYEDGGEEIIEDIISTVEIHGTIYGSDDDSNNETSAIVVTTSPSSSDTSSSGTAYGIGFIIGFVIGAVILITLIIVLVSKSKKKKSAVPAQQFPQNTYNAPAQQNYNQNSYPQNNQQYQNYNQNNYNQGAQQYQQYDNNQYGYDNGAQQYQNNYGSGAQYQNYGMNNSSDGYNNQQYQNYGYNQSGQQTDYQNNNGYYNQ